MSKSDLVLESHHEKKFRQYVTGRGDMLLKLNPMWFKGIPDRLLLMGMGRAVFIEMKTPFGSLSNRQKWTHKQLRGLGFDVRTAYTFNEAVAIYEELKESD